MIYYLNGSQCTFTEMLAAYVANSTTKEEHLLGMVVGLSIGTFDGWNRRRLSAERSRSTLKVAPVVLMTAKRAPIPALPRHAAPLGVP
jgi:hypothetical protein